MADEIQWKWVAISIVIFLIAQAALGVVFFIFGIITLGIGWLLFIIFKPVVYFVGGYITGLLSPGITIREPAIGAIIVVVLGTLFDSHRYHHGLLGLLISGAVAYGCALIGAKIAEEP